MATDRICSIPECGNPHSKRGYCNTHFLRWKRHGDPLVTKRRVDPNNCGKSECPAAKKVWGHVHYLQNSDAYRARAKKWTEENPGAYQERLKTYFSRPEIKERARSRMKEWVAKNPDRKREQDREFTERNRSLVTSYKAQYRAARRRATPPWLTKEQISQIRAVYSEARTLSAQTGVKHDVDHIVPLAGRIVSGLHVPWNLRAIPRDVNNRRPRIYAGD